jgi:hypothetical protein
MGMPPFKYVLFEGAVPEITRIAAKVVELSGLAVRIRQTVDCNSAKRYEVEGSLAFECASNDAIWLIAIREGAETETLPYWAQDDGEEDPPGKRVMYLSFEGLEPTLRTYILLALQALGGELKYPLDEATRRLCAAPITKLELERRKWKASASYLVMLFMTFVTAPLQPLSGFHWPKYSRADLNTGMRQIHVQFGMEGEPDQFGRIRYAWFRIVHAAFLPFLLIGSIFAAVATGIGALLMFLYSSVTFVGKTVRLVFHMLITSHMQA